MNCNWLLPNYFKIAFPFLSHCIEKTHVDIHLDDQLLCGVVTSKAMNNHILGDHSRNDCAKILWVNYIPPSKAFFRCRLLQSRLPIEEVLHRHWFTLVSWCCLCKKDEKSFCQLLVHCLFIVAIWDFISSLFFFFEYDRSFLLHDALRVNMGSEISNLWHASLFSDFASFWSV